MFFRAINTTGIRAIMFSATFGASSLKPARFLFKSRASKLLPARLTGIRGLYIMPVWRWVIAALCLAILCFGAVHVLLRSATRESVKAAHQEITSTVSPAPQLQALPVVTPVSAVRAEPPARAKSVRVAAVQCASRMGKIHYNRQLLSELITAAAAQQAKIIVLPECAVQGYMSVPQNLTWHSSSDAEDALPVANVAENIPGSSTRHFAALAKQFSVYIALPLIEEHDGAFYNSLVLLDPAGNLAAHHRKRAMWPPGDGTWATAGNRPAQVVETPYGKLGLMICYDLHEMPKQLKKAGAEIVLYAVGWFGPNTENWYRDLFPRRYVVPNEFAVVAANWSAEKPGAAFEGAGYSCVIDRNGVVLAMAKDTVGSEIVIADLPVNASKVSAVLIPDDE